MRTVLRSFLISALLVAASVAVTGIAQAGVASFDLPVVMDAGQEVPPVDLPDAFGFGNVTYDSMTEELSWDLAYEDLSGPVASAHIHAGAAGVNGGVIVDLLTNSVDDGSSLVGSVMIDMGTASQIATGDTYVNLHTADNGSGEIRGQVQQRMDFLYEAGLDPDQETIAPTGDVDEARGTGTLSYDALTDTLTWNVEYSGLTGPAAAAHVHGPADFGEGAGVLVDIGGGGLDSPITGSSMAPTSGAVLAAILAGRTYFNVHTGENDAGEIRGQIQAILFADDFEGEGLDVL